MALRRSERFLVVYSELRTDRLGHCLYLIEASMVFVEPALLRSCTLRPLYVLISMYCPWLVYAILFLNKTKKGGLQGFAEG